MAFPDEWGRRCALVIQSDQVTDNEVNFPLLVTEDTLPSEIFDADGSYPALNGGGDIRFSSDEAGNTQLACEIESFITDNDPANGKAAIWVKVPSLSSSSNTTIYIWYNKAGESQPTEDNAYGKENVWDSNFVMVQHMNQIPDGTADEIVDSTSNDNDGTTSGMDSADQVAGQIDGSLDFDGMDYITASDSPSFDSIETNNRITINAWINPDSEQGPTTPNFRTIASRGPYDEATTQWLFVWDHVNNELEFVIDGGARRITRSSSLSADTFYMVTVIYDGSDLIIYKNGVQLGTKQSETTGLGGASNNIVAIGYDYDSGSDRYFRGLIDEVRISNVARSAGWIATEYNNQYAPWTFLIEGTPETPGAPPVGAIMNQFQGASLGADLFNGTLL